MDPNPISLLGLNVAMRRSSQRRQKRKDFSKRKGKKELLHEKNMNMNFKLKDSKEKGRK